MNGHLIIADAEGTETFRGRSFKGYGLEDEVIRRHKQRAQAAIDRLEKKLRADMDALNRIPTHDPASTQRG